jgi:hypothetical protein
MYAPLQSQTQHLFLSHISLHVSAVNGYHQVRTNFCQSCFTEYVTLSRRNATLNFKYYFIVPNVGTHIRQRNKETSSVGVGIYTRMPP